jgi:hypothetical protein
MQHPDTSSEAYNAFLETVDWLTRPFMSYEQWVETVLSNWDSLQEAG